jgi:Fe-S oxidoreductase
VLIDPSEFLPLFKRGAGPDSPARARVREALHTGSDVLAVACPGCSRMLGDAVNAEVLQGKIRVADLAELVNERLTPS